MFVKAIGSLILFARAVLALRQPYEYLTALNDFQTGFLNPAPILAALESPALAKDVVGRVDITTTYVGNQLNTEYLYGLWLGITEETNITSLIGAPVNQTVQTLLIEPPLVFVSTITDLAYPSINLTLPIQIDAILRFNDALKIESYDITFRRWPDAFKYLLPTLVPQIATELGQTYEPTMNTSLLLAQKVANDVCSVANQYCFGNNTQYASFAACTDFITNVIPFGDSWEGGLNTGLCRYIHKHLVQYRPDIHCAQIGPSGGDLCINRDYDQIVRDFPFNSTLQAPSATVTPGDLNGLSAKSVDALSQASLDVVSPTTVAFYPLPAMVMFIIIYLSTKLIERVLSARSTVYREMGLRNQRNTVNYFINAFYTTVALGLQLPATATLGGIYSFNSIQCLKMTALLISILYIWELGYRVSLRTSLIAHHFCTLLAIFALFITLEETWHPALVPAGVIWLFQATTEQSIFVGMIMYRLKYDCEKTRRVLQFAAIQSFVVKFAFAVCLLGWWGATLAKNHKVGTDVFFSVIVCIMDFALLTTQAYGSWAVWCISNKLKNPDKECKHENYELELEQKQVACGSVLSSGSSNTLTLSQHPPELPELRLELPALSLGRDSPVQETILSWVPC